jgi:hypothetical protein
MTKMVIETCWNRLFLTIFNSFDKDYQKDFRDYFTINKKNTPYEKFRSRGRFHQYVCLLYSFFLLTDPKAEKFSQVIVISIFCDPFI